MAKDKKEEVKMAQKVEAPKESGGKKPLSELPAFKNNPQLPNPGKLISRLNHAATIAYNGEALVVPPRAQGKHAIVIADIAKLGALPSGVELLKGL